MGHPVLEFDFYGFGGMCTMVFLKLFHCCCVDLSSSYMSLLSNIELEEMSTEASVSGSYGAFSASASAAYSSLTDSIQSNENYAKNITRNEITFKKDFLQIFETVVTTVIIDGRTATETKQSLLTQSQ